MPRTKQNVSALCFNRRGRLLSVATNSYTHTHPLQAYYSNKVGKPDGIYLHAELAALIKARLKGIPYKLVVIRTNKKGEKMYSAPCPACQMALKDFGIQVVEHS